MTDIYNYLDFREFIKDRIDLLKEENPRFSRRYFCNKSGLKSSSYLNMVMSGDRNIGAKGMYGICKGLGLSDKEANFFQSLVRFNQALIHEEKEKYYDELIGLYPKKHTRVIEAKYYKVFSCWYYVSILELVRLDSFRENFDWISKKFRIKVSRPRIKGAIKDLLEVGLLVRNETGRLKPADLVVSTPEEVSSMAVVNFHQQMLTLSLDALKNDPVDEKENSAIVVAMSKERIPEIKRRIQEFKRELVDMIEKENLNKTDVVYINLQLSKLTNGGK